MSFSTLHDEELIAENLRYLLWKNKVKRSLWAEQLASWANCSERRAESLLRTGRITAQEQARIAESTDVSEESLRFSRLIEERSVDVLSENLKHLLDSLPYGGNKKLADELEVDPQTVSRWRSGRQLPRPSHLLGISRYFALPIGTHLDADPIFLSLSPVTAAEQLEWVQRHVAGLSPEELHSLFPALERLLRSS
jgi:transcriptional regulator with XRE-family HTH domain